MELIKQIKQAETQAKEIAEQAKTDAASAAEEAKAKRDELYAGAESERKQVIEQAVAEAESGALGEVEKLKAKDRTQRQQLYETARGRMNAAVGKVMDYFKGL